MKNLDVALAIYNFLNEIVPKSVSYREHISYVADCPSHDRHYTIDATKIWIELNWKP